MQVTLSSDTSSTLLMITNDSAETLRLQVRGFSWDQKNNGEMVLKPTQDIVFFPTLLMLQPKEKRNIRVGTRVKASDIEKSYRIFVTELPPDNKDKNTAEGNQLRILTELGIPIFIHQGTAKHSVSIEKIVLAKHQVSFAILNTGNVHFSLRKINYSITNTKGSIIKEQSFDGWYVLSGGQRIYNVELTADECKNSKALNLNIETDFTTVTKSMDLPVNVCGP
ncbi:MAG: fimbria/pilus periplasmic chaperone [Deltaproteobacteria bacterium]|nr:fimbria/pilus periplasmic chaperone [Deltaproteobacteria bacterium]